MQGMSKLRGLQLLSDGLFASCLGLLMFFMGMSSPVASLHRSRAERDWPVLPEREFSIRRQLSSSPLLLKMESQGPLQIEELTSDPVLQEAFKRPIPVWKVTASLGLKDQMVCHLYAEEIPLASAVLAYRNQLLKGWEEHEISQLSAGAFEGSPYLFLEQTYAAYKGKEMGLGHGPAAPEGGRSPQSFRIVAVELLQNKELSGVICQHQGVANRQTMLRIVEKLKKSILRGKGEAGILNKVFLLKIQEQVLGVSQHQIWRPLTQAVGEMAKPTWEAWGRSSQMMLFPRSKKDLVAMDHRGGQRMDDQGRLLEGQYQVYEGGELKKDLKIQRSGPGKYQIQGSIQGKELRKSLQLAEDLISDLKHRELIMQNLQRTMVRTKKEATDERPKFIQLPMYTPELSPLAPLMTEYRFLGPAADGRGAELELQIGPVKSHLTVDELGHEKEIATGLGANLFKAQRIYLSLGREKGPIKTREAPVPSAKIMKMTLESEKIEKSEKSEKSGRKIYGESKGKGGG